MAAIVTIAAVNVAVSLPRRLSRFGVAPPWSRVDGDLALLVLSLSETAVARLVAAIKDGMKNLIEVPVEAGTIPHRVEGNSGTAKVILLPASPGTGIIAGAAVRAVCESAGIRDVLTKAHGSTNPVNLVKAALDGLKQLRTKSEVERLRGVTLS